MPGCQDDRMPGCQDARMPGRHQRVHLPGPHGFGHPQPSGSRSGIASSGATKHLSKALITWGAEWLEAPNGDAPEGPAGRRRALNFATNTNQHQPTPTCLRPRRRPAGVLITPRHGRFNRLSAWANRQPEPLDTLPAHAERAPRGTRIAFQIRAGGSCSLAHRIPTCRVQSDQ